MHTRQSVFDTVASALIAQGRPSITTSNGLCLYRGPEGTKCGIGHLIPDAEYDDNIEGSSADSLIEGTCIGPTVVAIATLVGVDFLSDMQSAHDAASKHSDFVASFKDNMKLYAKNYKLNPASVEG